jgi:hypothetical protein
VALGGLHALSVIQHGTKSGIAYTPRIGHLGESEGADMTSDEIKVVLENHKQCLIDGTGLSDMSKKRTVRKSVIDGDEGPGFEIEGENLIVWDWRGEVRSEVRVVLERINDLILLREVVNGLCVDRAEKLNDQIKKLTGPL